LGVNFGEKRGRMEPLNPSAIAGYAIGTRDIKFEHLDSSEVNEIINRRLDVVQRRFRERV